MPLPPPSAEPPPFIATQRLFRLRPAEGQAALPPDVQRAWLRPETFRLRRRISGKNQSAEEIDRLLPGGAAWEEVPDREAFLSDASIRRLCLTVDAGCGKTIAMYQAQYLLHARHKGHPAILLNFDQLPRSVNLYLGPSEEAAGIRRIRRCW
jgi:hypothetical protein